MIFQRIFENIKQIQTREGVRLKTNKMKTYQFLPEICELLLLHLFFV